MAENGSGENGPDDASGEAEPVDREPTVLRNPDRERYELRLDGRLIGYARYEVTESGMEFTHTEVDPDFEGHGLGGTLVKAAMEDAASRDQIIVPHCPFVQAFLKRHHEYDPHVLWPVPKHQRGGRGDD